MQYVVVQYIVLIIIILGLVMIANRLKLAYPIVLVLGGLALSFIPIFSHFTIDPGLVFFIFLPPLLYEAAWSSSWKQLYKWRRVITSFAFPIVILTSLVIALFSNAIIPGFTLALGFLLGGIVSPPDAISATTIMRRLTVSKSMLSIIEGESLLNDASSLIVFRFALAAIITGQFHFSEAAGNFFLVIIMGTVIGLLIGLVIYAFHRWLPTTSSIEIVLSIVTPYCMYLTAEHFHYSGVLAVVAGGLFLSSKRQEMMNYRSRIEGVNVWTNLVFVLNGLVFMLIGLQMPTITQQLGDTSLMTAIGYALAISFALIITRLLCAFGALFFTMFMSRFITVADPNPGWKGPLVLGWAGMRGVVSLAAALSIPVLANGEPFPYRNLILFITFMVILVTLVLQGLTLPWLIRRLNIEDRFAPMPEQRQEIVIQKKMAHYTLEFLKEKFGEKAIENHHIRNLYEKLTLEMSYYGKRLDGGFEGAEDPVVRFRELYLQVLDRQRKILKEMNSKTEFDEELIRKYLTLIDLEEFKLREKIVDEAGES